MEHYKIFKLLNNSNVSKFLTKKWIEANDLSSGQNSVNRIIKLKTSMLRLGLSDYSNAYIVVKGTITVQGMMKMIADDNNKKEIKTIL